MASTTAGCIALLLFVSFVSSCRLLHARAIGDCERLGLAPRRATAGVLFVEANQFTVDDFEAEDLRSAWLLEGVARAEGRPLS